MKFSKNMLIKNMPCAAVVLCTAAARAEETAGGEELPAVIATDEHVLLPSYLLIILLLLLLLFAAAIILLVRARKKWKEANEAKMNFLYNMSRDIRAPLNAILLYTEVAGRHPEDTERVADCLNKTKHAGELLLSLIDNILEISRMKTGKPGNDEMPGMVDYSFEDIKSTVLAMAEEKNIDLTFEIGKISDHYVYADYALPERLFITLISNAVKYTDNGGRIRVKCEQIGRRGKDFGLYRYIFEDNGVGMSEEYQEHMFDAFARDMAPVFRPTGSGINLHLVKTYVDAMQGTIECRSKLNEGTVFTVTLPFRLQKEAERARYIQPDTKHVMVADTGAEDKPACDFAGKRVLVADDNEIAREVTVSMLEEEELAVEQAADGTGVLALLKEKGPDYFDAVLLDIEMPKMDGYETARSIRQLYPKAKLPVISYSVNNFPEDKAASFSAGINAHILKPLRVREFLETLEELLGS